MRSTVSPLRLLCAASVIVAACGGGETNPRWVLRFEDAAGRQAARVVRGQILEAGCGGRVLHDVTLRPGDGAGLDETPPRLEPGRYGFSGRAVDENCVVVAEGCVEVDLPVGEIVVPLRSGGSISVCPPATCDDGECNDRALVAIATGRAHSCAADFGGRLYCWGYNETGQVGDGTVQTRSTPVLIDEDLRISGLSAGGTGAWLSHTCAIEDNDVLCWGYNADGQVGDGSQDNRLRPVRLGLAATSVSAGGQHTCAVETNGGRVSCWGSNTYGQLGVDSDVERLIEPTALSEDEQVEVAAGRSFTCIRHISGRVRCFGRNHLGQLGRGDLVDRRQPGGALNIDDVVRDIDAGGDHACAVTQNGAVWCWGSNEEGQLGRAGANAPSPELVAGIDDAVEVAAGGAVTCVRRETGDVVCFGYDAFGERGGGESVGEERNAVLGVTDAYRISMGSNHGCVVRDSGEVWCWGQAQHGRLGNGEETIIPGGFAPLSVSFPVASEPDVDAGPPPSDGGAGDAG